MDTMLKIDLCIDTAVSIFRQDSDVCCIFSSYASRIDLLHHYAFGIFPYMSIWECRINSSFYEIE